MGIRENVAILVDDHPRSGPGGYLGEVAQLVELELGEGDGDHTGPYRIDQLGDVGEHYMKAGVCFTGDLSSGGIGLFAVTAGKDESQAQHEGEDSAHHRAVYRPGPIVSRAGSVG